MTNSSIDRVTVLGAGVLGGQIAWHSAFMCKTVVSYDLSQEALEKAKVAHDVYAGIYKAEMGASDADIEATRKRLSYSNNLKRAVSEADLVIEAVPEVPEIKTSVYKEVAALMPEHTIIATNTSTFLPRDFAEATGRPEKFCSMHFANLIWRLNLGEVMGHPGTSQDTLSKVMHYLIEIGQVPIPIEKEQNRYVLNTWLGGLMKASLSLVVNGVATPEDVDRTYMIANRGCALGPCGLADVVGMNTLFNSSSYWGKLNDDEQMLKNAAYIKENFLDKGLQGMMGGQGFYSYPNPAYAEPGFLDVPDASAVPELVRRATLG